MLIAEQFSRLQWDKTNKGGDHFELCKTFCLSSGSSASLVLQYGGFVPREWLVVKGLFFAYYYHSLFTLYS